MAQLVGLFTGDGPRQVLMKKDHYAFDMVFLFVVLLIDRTIGCEPSYDLTLTNVEYTDILHKALVGHEKVRWVERKFSELRSETEEFTRAVRRVTGPHCTSGLYTLNFHLLKPLVKTSEKFRSMSFTDAEPFEHFNVLIKQS